MKNILFLYPFGGTAVKRSSHIMAQGIIIQLKKFDYKIYVIPKDKSEVDFANLNDLGIINVSTNFKLYIKLKKRFNLNLNYFYFKNIANKLQDLEISVILERHSLFNLGYYLSKYTDIPYVTNDVVVFPDLIFYGRKIQKLLLKLFPVLYQKYIFKKESKPLRHAKTIVSHSEAYTQILIQEYGIESQKIFQFYAMVDHDVFKNSNYDESREKLGYSKNDFIVLYVGSFDRLHSPDLMIPIINNFTEEHVKYLLLGDGNLLTYIKSNITNNNVRYMGRVSRELVLTAIQASDLCIETIWNDKVRKYGADSIKIYEYLSCGKPVIASNLPGQIQKLEEVGAGILINPTDYARFVNAIKNLYENPRLQIEIGKNARKLVEDSWNWNFTGSVFHSALKNAIKKK